MMFDLSAQKKVLTMEEAVMGYHLYPRSKYIQWQGDKNQLTYLDREGLMSESVDKGEKKVLLTVAELNKILGAELKGFPNFSWLDANTLVIARQGTVYHIDVVKKQAKLILKQATGMLTRSVTTCITWMSVEIVIPLPRTRIRIS